MPGAIAALDVPAGVDATAPELSIGIVVGIVMGSPCIANSPASVATVTAAYASSRRAALRWLHSPTTVITSDYIRIAVRTCHEMGIGVNRKLLSERPHGCRVE